MVPIVITADEIKVDRSFITDIHKRPRSQSILKAIESLSQALGITIIVEGVETFEELAYLRRRRASATPRAIISRTRSRSKKVR